MLTWDSGGLLDVVCVFEGTDAASFSLEQWMEADRGMGSAIEVSGTLPLVSWEITIIIITLF